MGSWSPQTGKGFVCQLEDHIRLLERQECSGTLVSPLLLFDGKYITTPFSTRRYCPRYYWLSQSLGFCLDTNDAWGRRRPYACMLGNRDSAHSTMELTRNDELQQCASVTPKLKPKLVYRELLRRSNTNKFASLRSFISIATESFPEYRGAPFLFWLLGTTRSEANRSVRAFSFSFIFCLEPLCSYWNLLERRASLYFYFYRYILYILSQHL